jgi:cytochrome P450
MHDETLYSDPFTFKPERFLPKDDGGLGEMSPVPTVFGYGHRICPGIHLAESSLWAYAASLLAVFDIMPVKDASGQPIPPVVESGPEIIRSVSVACVGTCFVWLTLLCCVLGRLPKPFGCDIKPRSAASASLVG